VEILEFAGPILDQFAFSKGSMNRPVRELADLELALVGGGVGDVIFL
jgi:hypothetical protein